jgi:Protein of unknown function (DUF1194)
MTGLRLILNLPESLGPGGMALPEIKEPDRGEDATIDAYYRDCVIGGSNAFMIPVRERKQFMTETRAKIVREIASVGG